MAEILKTNVCCLDLTQDCIDYLKSLDLNVYDGSLGSVYSVRWGGPAYEKTLLVDVDFPINLHEFHILIHDMENPRKRDYKSDEHQITHIDSGDNRHLECHYPVNTYDLRPYGLHKLRAHLNTIKNFRRIEILFVGSENSVEYVSNAVATHNPRRLGPLSNIDDWILLVGEEKYGKRVKLGESGISRVLFENRLNLTRYYRVFVQPTMLKDNKRVPDDNYIPLLVNEDGEWVSYLNYHSDDYIQVVLPQVDDKAALLKDLFENVLLKFFSDYFPDIEAHNWIYHDTYQLTDEFEIQRRIDDKRREYESEISQLEEKAASIRKKNLPLKNLLTETGSALVGAVKSFLEWLGFENVIDKDETLKDGELKEEDISFDYNGIHMVMEVKGINGTSTDSECSQVDKIVNRRMRELKTTDVHGLYVVNHQRNIEPIKRQMPPFNENQIKDAKNLSRALVYTTQLFSLHSDIENGYISKDLARSVFLQAGLADFHSHLTSLGVPYNYYQDDMIICLDLNHTPVCVGDKLFYEDPLKRLVELKVESLQQGKQDYQTLSVGKTGIKVDKKVPRNKVIYLAGADALRRHFPV